MFALQNTLIDSFKTLVLIRVSNASGFYLRANASPVNSVQLRAIREQLADLRLETLVLMSKIVLKSTLLYNLG